ncbi:ferric iron reductase [Propioniciclava flava]|nr:ferric iron reductase [Propioniciclava flava]
MPNGNHLDLSQAETVLHGLTPTMNLSVGGQWIPAADLLAAPSIVAALVAEHARIRSISVPRHAASLFFQRYCHRLCSATLGVWVLTGMALDASARQVSVQIRDGSPAGVQFTGRLRPTHTPEDLVSGLVEEHLLPLAAQLQGAARLSQPQTWGNIAAALGMSARTLSTVRPAAEVLRAVAPVFGTREVLQRLGSCRILEGPHGPRLFYDRASCCHWFEIPEGSYCSYCSRLTHEERTCRFIDAMAAETPTP